MPKDTKVNSLIINTLTEEQYASAEKNANELYLTPETPASTTNLGPVKVDGTTITANEDGIISANIDISGLASKEELEAVEAKIPDTSTLSGPVTIEGGLEIKSNGVDKFASISLYRYNDPSDRPYIMQHVGNLRLTTPNRGNVFEFTDNASNTITRGFYGDSVLWQTNKDVADGVAGLDSNGKLSANQIPVDGESITVDENGNLKTSGGSGDGRSVGQVFFSQSELATDNPGALPLFTGETIASANTVYPDLYNFVSNHSELQCTEEEYETILTEYGECAKYALGSNYIQSYKWHIPNINIDVYTTHDGSTYHPNSKDGYAYADAACTEIYMYNGISVRFSITDDNGTIKPYFDYRADDGQTAIEILEPNSYILMDVPGEPNGSLRLPLLKNYIKAANVTEGIKNIEAGLPNIEGSAERIRVGSTFFTGALSETTTIGATSQTMANVINQQDIFLKIDASKSSEVYGKSDTVTPASTTLYPWVVAYTAAIPASTAQAAEFQQALTGKVDTNTLVDATVIIETYADADGNWYRLYSDGWCEQGGMITFTGVSVVNEFNYIKPINILKYLSIQSTIYVSQAQANNCIYPKNSTQFAATTGNSNYSQMFYWYAAGYAV